MDEKKKTRLAELKKEREEIEAYKEQHEDEFGPTDGALLDALEEYVMTEGEIRLCAANGNESTGMRGITDGSLREEIVGDGIREFIIDLIRHRQ